MLDLMLASFGDGEGWMFGRVSYKREDYCRLAPPCRDRPRQELLEIPLTVVVALSARYR